MSQDQDILRILIATDNHLVCIMLMKPPLNFTSQNLPCITSSQDARSVHGSRF